MAQTSEFTIVQNYHQACTSGSFDRLSFGPPAES